MQMTGNSRPASGAEYLRVGDFGVKDYVDIETDLIEEHFKQEELCENIKKIHIPNLLDTVAPEKLKERTEEIVKLIEEIPAADTIRDMLGIVHGVTGPSELGLKAGMK
ncbi:MAG: sn-glycerol-1-phosphate dehydrogenase [Dorea sp.]|jgi:glycerol-1-phosphate dehydrogenase [NAD(P)+]|nr:sn-glycerol-1-phosphate dehydrogenase [Dorea sp.]